jgi:hypothetical protein
MIPRPVLALLLVLPCIVLALAACPGADPNPPHWGVAEEPAAEALDASTQDAEGDAP